VTLAELVSALRLAGARSGQAARLADDPTAPGSAALEQTVTRVAYDSRQVVPGAVFVAMRGLKADGVAYAREAIGRGAVAVVAEAPPPPDLASGDVPWIRTGDARLALAELAAAFYGHPSRELLLIGITGTNGKTTTSYLVASIFDRAGVPCGRIGTIGYRLPGRPGSKAAEEREAARTTPEASGARTACVSRPRFSPT
jgi:UDP-N-acetylmuramoyl-L-alanyl-D-glutamate--2,6-diaminopimelate ligase